METVETVGTVFDEDRADMESNYWTAALYFRAQNGTFKRVKQHANIGLVQREGMTVYYIPPYDGVSTVTAFKPVRISSPPLAAQRIPNNHTDVPGLPHARRQPPSP
jgi:hypothetical protein